MQLLRMNLNLMGVPAHVVERALQAGFAGSRTDVVRSALIAYGEKYGLLDREGVLKSEVKKSLRRAALEKGISTAVLKRRLGP